MRHTKLDLADLRGKFAGEVTLPGDRDYDALRKPWLQDFDQHPAVIVDALSADDVISAVNVARTYSLPLSVMSTGHGIAAPCNDGLLLRMSRLKRIWIDEDNRTASIQPGVLSGELLLAAEKHHLAYPAGEVSNVGVVGFTLGGGIGWIVRKAGAAADSIVRADVVLADGSMANASTSGNRDLLWAIRGGGGNFGIVTTLEIHLADVDRCIGGEIYYDLERAAEIMRFYRTWTAALDDDTSTVFRLVNVPANESAPTPIRGKTCCMIGVCHANPATAKNALGPLDDLGTPMLSSVKPCTLSDLAALNPASHMPGTPAYGQVEFLKHLSDGVIDSLVSVARTLMPPLMQIELRQLGGAFVRRADDRGAFHAPRAQYLLHIESTTAQGAMGSIVRATQEALNALGDSYTGEKYYNFMRGDEQPMIDRAFGQEKFARLRKLKRKFDPDNLFRLNLNIPPG